MSTIKVTNLRHESASSSNITLDSSNNAVVAGTLGCTGDLTITSGNLVVSSGNGIDFSATANSSGTMSSELLDDYEEGTWAPSVGGTATYVHQAGKYTKIGNTVFIEGHMQITSLGTGSTTTMSGLPFTSGSSVEGGLHVTYFSGLAVNVISVVLGINASNTNTLAYSRTSGGTASSGVAIYGDGARIFFYGHYFV